MSHSSDYLIVGAGIIGLAIAWELRKRHPSASITILEKEPEVGLHASGRNSGVLHSGIYYGSDTLQAKVRSSGAEKMQEFAKVYSIACNRSGKIIIATSQADLPSIDRLLTNAEDNSIKVKRIDEQVIKKIETHASPYRTGIYSPDTAVSDSKSVAKKLYSLLKEQDVKFELSFPLLEQNEQEKTVSTQNRKISYGYVYNCAGAHADRVAKLFGKGEDYTMVSFKRIL